MNGPLKRKICTKIAPHILTNSSLCTIDKIYIKSAYRTNKYFVLEIYFALKVHFALKVYFKLKVDIAHCTKRAFCTKLHFPLKVHSMIKVQFGL